MPSSTGADSHSVPSVSLPLQREGSRRGSVASVISHINKEALSQALDQIHSTASQSHTLTTFGQYAAPTSSTIGEDVKGITSDISGGLNGLYAKIRASVGGAREARSNLSDSYDGENSSPPQSPRFRAVAGQVRSRHGKGARRPSPAMSASSADNRRNEAVDSHPERVLQDTLSSRGPESPRQPAHGSQNRRQSEVGSGGLEPNGAETPKVLSTQRTMQPFETHSRVSSNPSMLFSDPNSIDTNTGIERGRDITPVKAAEPELSGRSIDIDEGVLASSTQPRTRLNQRRSERASLANIDTGSTESTSLTVNNLDAKGAVGGSSTPKAKPTIPILSLSRASTIDVNAADVTESRRSSATGYRDASNGSRNLSVVEEYPPPKTSKTVTTQRNRSDTLQVRGRLLDKDYWMRDENANDCFYCGKQFSTFRRKHHCRTCGQIFDAECTAWIPGSIFGQSSNIRVCKPCEGIIKGNDDSSEYSDDGSIMNSGLRPRHGSSGTQDISPARSFASLRMANAIDEDRASENMSLSRNNAPTIGIPARRRAAKDLNRRSAILEIDSEPRMARPGSSRSIKSVLSQRNSAIGHRRHNSRPVLGRGPKTPTEERAPFHQTTHNGSDATSKLPAFHSDNIIDPDLAAYLSDDESSDEEQLSIMSTLRGTGSPTNGASRHFAGLSVQQKKSRSRIWEKNHSHANLHNHSDSHSLYSARLGGTPRSHKRRNLSINSSILLRPSPRIHRFSSAAPAASSHLHESASNNALGSVESLGAPHITRSSSMKGAAAPAVEMNQASLKHVHRLLNQLLTDFEIPNIKNWEKALLPILLKATDDVKPDLQQGDDMDIRHYVKLKKIPGGRPDDTAYVSGLVFTKNLALKSMPRKLSHPNILILTFPVEYARHQQHFMSLEPVIRQEREYLQNLVHRIAALKPNLLLVQRNVSGLALELLEQANIATAYNVKLSVLEAISRCAQTRIISSVDKLAIKPTQAGKCSSFYLKTYVHSGARKTYMYVSGCPKKLGCTIVLRGGDEKTLPKIKRITEFMIYVVYNLRLETSLLRDEFAMTPNYNGEGTILDETSFQDSASRASKACSTATSEQSAAAQTSDIPTLGISQTSTISASMESLEPNQDNLVLPDDIPLPTYYADMVDQQKTKILSASPFVRFMAPYLLMKAREEERRLIYLKRLRDRDAVDAEEKDDISKQEKFRLIQPEMIHETVQGTSKKVREVLLAVHDAEYDKALHHYRTQKKQWETYIAGNIDMFEPFAHQNIVVLYSVVCTATSVPCSGPDLLALGFYNEHETGIDFEADCTLGQYVEDLCLGASTICTVNGCERKMSEHHRQYVHGTAQLSVNIEAKPSRLPGLQDTILMWSTCRICGNETQVTPMSENTWKYSFGKYLELSYWSTDLRSRAGGCAHDLHRNYWRYFGFRNVAIRLQYDPITLLEIIVPRTRITWKVVNDLKFKNQVFIRSEERLNKFMISVKDRIKGIRLDTVIPERTETCKEEIERLTKLADEEHQALLQKLQDKYTDSKYFEVVPLNRAVRAMQEKVAEWDNRFADFDTNFFPSEKDIRRLATAQLKKIFLDKDDSVSSFTSTEEKSSTSASQTDPSTTSSPDGYGTGSRTSDDFVEKEKNSEAKPGEFTADQLETPKQKQVELPTPSVLEDGSGEMTPLADAGSRVIKPLDLAVPSFFADHSADVKARMPDTRGVSPTEVSPKTAKRLPPLEIEDTPSKDSASVPGLEEKNPERPVVKESVSSSQIPISSIPRPVEASTRRGGKEVSHTINRTQSTPAKVRREKSSGSGSGMMFVTRALAMTSRKDSGDLSGAIVPDHIAKLPDKKLSDRLGLTTLKANVANHSMIPRSIASRRKESRVSALAKHFEQLSREFEKERTRERRMRAAKTQQARAYPMASSKPIVEVFASVHEAVNEEDPSEEDLINTVKSFPPDDKFMSAALGLAKNAIQATPGEGYHEEDTAAEDTAAENTEAEDSQQVDSRVATDDEDEAKQDDSLEQSLSLADDESKLDLPKHEKTSLVKMLSNFWAERSASGWQPLEYPLTASDHVFADSDIIIREDEPSSLIAFALSSEDYKVKLQNIHDKSENLAPLVDKPYSDELFLTVEEQVHIERSLLQATGTHLKYQFQEGSAKMLCKIFYAEQFDAVRRKCGVADRIVESLSRCMKWDSKGGKTKSVFLKTLDDRIVLKSLSQIETQAFLRFAPAYFQLMGEALFHDLPSVIAKMLGFYQIIIKNPVTGVEFNWFILAMENLFYDRSPTRIFDLKGSMRNRRIQSTGEQNEVLLDENMVEFIYESPLFTREHSKKLLRASVWNDTLFLSRQNVMDYSLMVAIDESRKELVVGIIDCIRTYTWDKKLESWMKDRGKNRPTVTSPKEYKSRFREAMGRYVLQAPNCWHQFKAPQVEARATRFDSRLTGLGRDDDKGEGDSQVVQE